MSGFETRWLDLREPADRAARDPALLRRAAAHAGRAGDAPLIVNLGCGTGSTLRALGPLVQRARWRLVDNDPALLDEARRRRPEGIEVATIEADLSALDQLDLSDTALVTASALFDLASEGFVATLAARLARAGTALYAALSYDGTCTWLRPHPLDAAIVALFNRHQRSDKGFGPALGPEAGDRLKAVFASEGFTVEAAESPWRLGPESADLERMFVAGMADAVEELGELGAGEVEGWRTARLEASGEGLAVGHLDVLAVPPEQDPSRG